MVVARFLFLRKENPARDYSNYVAVKKRAIVRNRVLSTLFQWLLLFDYYCQILPKVIVPHILGKNLIVDRYIYDTLVTDLAVDFGYSEKKLKHTLASCLHFFPRPHLVLLIDVLEETAFIRKNDVLSLDYLKERREVYLQLGKEHGVAILDGSNNQDQVKETAKARVFHEFKL